MLVVMETLSPLERAVFVLREAFELPFAEIAEIIGREEAATRQLAKRAREHVQERRPRFEVDPARRREMTERFLAAAARGDLSALSDMLAEDVQLISDGGGRVRAPRRVVEGADKVRRFFGGIASPRAAELFQRSAGLEPGPITFTVADLNGAPAILAMGGGRLISVVSLLIADGLITTVYLIANPEKIVDPKKLGHIL
jgi:RNA polymerase sigma-70 factor (ECF subfamily)